MENGVFVAWKPSSAAYRMRDRWARSWGMRGLVSGALGAVAIGVSEMGETRVLRRRPVYSASVIARRLLRQHHPTLLSNALGFGLRCTYGPMLGLAVALARRRLSMTTLATAAVSSAVVATGELSVLPLLGAMQPWNRWPTHQKWLFGARVVAWGLVNAIAYDSLKAAK